MKVVELLVLLFVVLLLPVFVNAQVNEDFEVVWSVCRRWWRAS